MTKKEIEGGIIMRQLEQAIKARGIKKKWFCEQIGINFSTFWRWINKGIKPREIHLDKIAKVLNVNKREFFNEFYK